MDIATPTLLDPYHLDPEARIPTPFSPMLSDDGMPQSLSDITNVHVQQTLSIKDEWEEAQKIALPPLDSDEESILDNASPCNIPLPPSPPTSPLRSQPKTARIASRRPTGWISSVSSNRHSSPRTTSTVSNINEIPAVKPSGAGRKVSGALRHALWLDAEISTDHDPQDFSFSEHISIPSSPTSETSLSPDDSQSNLTNDLLDIREISASQENDEAWMDYVRQQLGSLFPDLENDLGLDHSALIRQEGGGDTSLRTEMAGLKDEIGRLRGVVGELALGIKSTSTPPGGKRFESLTTNPIKTDQDVSQDFLATADLSISIIRMIDVLTRPMSTPQTELTEDDYLLFSLDNLGRIQTVLTGWMEERVRLENMPEVYV